MTKKVKRKVQSVEQITKTAEDWRGEGLDVVFTNGCFDLLHYGHLHYLADARACGDKLIIEIGRAHV